MALLELRKLTKSFGGLTAVNKFDLIVEKGQIIGLIGPNGAGKTTAFNLISGTYRPTNGKVLFKGMNITGLKPHNIAGLGLVRSFQQTMLFSEMTVLENILMGFHLKSNINFWGTLFGTASTQKREKHLIDRAVEIAHLMGLEHVRHELAKNLPHGYQRSLGVAIVLATDPELVLLDEPVTGMNTEETDWMMEKIRGLNKLGLTIFLVEHDMGLVMNICERIVVLNFGSKIAEGTPKEICENKEVIAAYLGSEYAARC